MPYLHKIRKAKWYKNDDPPWLNPNEIQADALTDIGTKDNELSVYLVDHQKNNLDQVAVALSLTRDFVSNFDYALIREEDLENARIKIRSDPKKGYTPDETVNSQHFDIYEITAQELLTLASIIRNSEIARITEIKMKEKAAKALFRKKNRFNQNTIKIRIT